MVFSYWFSKWIAKNKKWVEKVNCRHNAEVCQRSVKYTCENDYSKFVDFQNQAEKPNFPMAYDFFYRYCV